MTVKKTQQNLSTTLENTEQVLGGLENSLGNDVEASLLEIAENSEANDGLPEGWVRATLADIAMWGSGGTPSRKNADYYSGEIPWVKTGDLGPRYVTAATEFITEEAVKNSSAKYFPKGSVALAMYGATIGKTSILGIDATTNQACAVGNPIESVTSTEYLYYFLKNEKDAFIAKGKGGAQPNISQALIKAHEISLPPLAEQTVIAQTLDTLLAQVDNIKTRLDAIPKILKTFRQSVLAAAVSGKLTEAWRGDNAYTGITQHHSAPSVWRAVNINTVIEYVTSGSRGWAAYYADEGSLFIRSQDINKDELDIVDAAYVCLPEKAEGRRTKVKKGDLLVTITGANVTKCARVKTELNDAYISQHVALIRLKDTTSANFIELVLKAGNAGRKQLTDMAYGGGKPGLNLQNIKDVEFSLPATEEQNEIVHRVKELFAFADQVEQQVKNAQGRVNNLTQSILAKAFRGELTAQWRAENPDLISGDSPENGSAELLLAKIKAEREALKKISKPKKKTAVSASSEKGTSK